MLCLLSNSANSFKPSTSHVCDDMCRHSAAQTNHIIGTGCLYRVYVACGWLNSARTLPCIIICHVTVVREVLHLRRRLMWLRWRLLVGGVYAPCTHTHLYSSGRRRSVCVVNICTRAMSSCISRTQPVIKCFLSACVCVCMHVKCSVVVVVDVNSLPLAARVVFEVFVLNYVC